VNFFVYNKLYTDLVLTDQHALIMTSAAAAAPMLVSTASPLFYLYVFKRTNSNNITLWALGLIWWLTSTGFDALAGYTFGRVAQIQGNAIITQMMDPY
jgi:hypothetical protein